MNTRKLLGAAALVGVLGAGGSAFTASNSMPAASVDRGYGSQAITGVTAESVVYNMNGPEDTIVSVGLVLSGDTTAKTIQIAFNDENPATCSGAGVFASGDTTYDCVVNRPVMGTVKFALIAE